MRLPRLVHAPSYLTVRRELFVIYYAPSYLFALLVLASKAEALAEVAHGEETEVKRPQGSSGSNGPRDVSRGGASAGGCGNSGARASLSLAHGGKRGSSGGDEQSGGDGGGGGGQASCGGPLRRPARQLRRLAAGLALGGGLGLAAGGFWLLRPLATGHGLAGRAYLDRLAAVTPGCWLGACFNAPPGSPLHQARHAHAIGGGDPRDEQAALFNLLASSM